MYKFACFHKQNLISPALQWILVTAFSTNTYYKLSLQRSPSMTLVICHKLVFDSYRDPSLILPWT